MHDQVLVRHWKHSCQLQRYRGSYLQLRNSRKRARGSRCEASHSLYSVRSSRPSGVRPGRCPCLHELCVGFAAYRHDEKVLEAPEEGTKEGAEITTKSGEKLEEGPPYRTLMAWVAKAPFDSPRRDWRLRRKKRCLISLISLIRGGISGFRDLSPHDGRASTARRCFVVDQAKAG